MVDIKSIRKKEIERTGIYSNKIKKRFKDLNVPLSKSTEEIPADLGDIREILNQYTKALDLLFSKSVRNDKKMIIELLKNIRNDLYIHLNFHLKELKNPLNKLITDLEKQL